MSAATQPQDDRAYQQALYAAAMFYVGQGFSVIPLGNLTYDANGKKSFPRLINWQREPDTLVTKPEHVEKWFGLISAARGIAIATGPSGLLMIDDDSYKTGTAESTPPQGAWIERHVGRGGWHAYLRNPTGSRNTAGALAAGIDTRGEGGLAICAPTRATHPDGSVTQWLTEAPLHTLAAATLPEAPAIARTPARRLVTAGTAEEITTDMAARAVAAGREEWLACVKGSRHHTMMKYLGVLARFELASGTPVSELYATLEAAVNEHPDAVAGEVFESAEAAMGQMVTYASASPWTLIEPSGFEDRFSAGPPAPAAGSPVDDGELFATGSGDFYDNPVPPPPPTYGAFGGELPLFYADGVHWLQGESESGKTWVGLTLVVELLGTGGYVIMVDHEDTRGNIVRKLRALGMTREQYERLVYVSGQDVTHAQLRTHLETTDRDYQLLLVDGVTSALSAAGASGRDEQETTRWVDQVPRKARMAICIDHVVKAIDDRQGMAIGTQAKKSVVTGTAWEVVALSSFGRGKSGVIELRPQKDKPGGVRGRLEAKGVRLDLLSTEGGDKVALTVQAAGFFSEPNEALFSALLADGVSAGVSALELQREAKQRSQGYGNRAKADMHKAWLAYVHEASNQEMSLSVDGIAVPSDGTGMINRDCPNPPGLSGQNDHRTPPDQP